MQQSRAPNSGPDIPAAFSWRVLLLLCALVVDRFCRWIPLPGLDRAQVEQFLTRRAAGIQDWSTIGADGAIDRLSIQALGLSPVICGLITVHLLAPVVPALRTELATGAPGAGRIGRFTLLATLAFGLVQAVGHAGALAAAGLVPEPDLAFFASSVATLVGASLFLAWLADRIGMLGFGNGILMLVAAWAIVQLPSNVSAMLEIVRIGAAPAWLLACVCLGLVAQAFLVVLVAGATRRIRIAFARTPETRRGEVRPPVIALPLSIAGVLPTIFAVYVVGYLAWTLATLLPASAVAFANVQGPVANAATGLMILGFTFFLAALFFEPSGFARSLANSGGVIPGIAAGVATANFLDEVATRLTTIAAGFLCIVCLAPAVLRRNLDPDYGPALGLLGYEWLLVVWVTAVMVGRVRSGEDRDAPEAS